MQNLKSNNCQFVQWDRMTQEEINSLELTQRSVQEFVNKHQDTGSKPMVFLTSGGTSVPLEKNTVRMLENFSTGTRGSLLAEEVLLEGHLLIFFYRDNSFLPFLSGITINSSVLSQNNQQLNRLSEAHKKLTKYIESSSLLLIPFKSIYSYLNGILLIKTLLPPKAILIMCAAVSDFIPEEISEHKIHTQNNLQLRFKNSPKILSQMVNNQHLTVSFKLETDPSKIEQRMKFALNKYQIDLVVGNILNNKKWVKIVYNQNYEKKASQINQDQISLTREFSDEIEKNIFHSILFGHKIKFFK